MLVTWQGYWREANGSEINFGVRIVFSNGMASTMTQLSVGDIGWVK